MSEREEILELADRIVATPAYSSGDIGAKIYQCDDQEQTDSSVDVILINANHRNNLAKALRSAATPAPGYAQGFEACRSECLRVTIDEREKCASNPGYMMAVKIRNAIAALPAPAGVEVTAEQLCKVIEGVSWNGDVPIQITKQILKSFTILAKPAQEGQGS